MTERFHGLDALRAGAMLLGVILHAALIFTEPAVLAAIRPGTEVTPTLPVIGLVLWIHLWRIPLFFVLAGFFAQMVLEKRGARGFITDRATRILATCLVFTLVFNLLTSQTIGTLDHLWFLWVLWWCCLLAAGLHASGVTRHIAIISRIYATPRRMFWLVLPLTVMSLLLRDETVIQRIPILLSDVEWRGFLFFLLFFWAGQALWLARAIIARLAEPRCYLPCLIAGTFATGLILTGAVIFGEDGELLNEDLQLLMLLTTAPLAAIATGALSVGFIGLSQHLITRSSALVHGLVRLAYPVYVLHLWPAIAISVLILDLAPGMPQMLNVAFSAAAAFATSVVLYFLLIRYTPLEWLFAGRKQAWWQWPFAANAGSKGRTSP